MGTAVLTGNTFDGTSQYSSTGCGMVTNHYRGSFSGDGNIMNMTMTLTSAERLRQHRRSRHAEEDVAGARWWGYHFDY